MLNAEADSLAETAGSGRKHIGRYSVKENKGTTDRRTEKDSEEVGRQALSGSERRKEDEEMLKVRGELRKTDEIKDTSGPAEGDTSHIVKTECRA